MNEILCLISTFTKQTIPGGGGGVVYCECVEIAWASRFSRVIAGVGSVHLINAPKTERISKSFVLKVLK